MNNDASFPDRQRAEPTFTSAPFVAPTAQMPPRSASPDDFDAIQDAHFFAMEQPYVYAGNDNVWRYDLEDPYQPHGSVYHEQFYQDQYLPEDPLHLGAGYQHLPETDVALGNRNGFTPGLAYSPAEVSPSYDNEFPTPSPNQSDNGNAVDAVEDAEAVESVDAVDNSLVDKEKQARAVLKKQRSQDSVTKQMGESVIIVQTATGLQFGGVYWTAPANDETIPSLPAEINARIDTLTKAMQNKEDCREKTTTGQYRNRWSKDSSYYSEDHFKAAARELVVAMVDIHQNGWTKTIFDKGERENCQATMFYTFEDRFEALRGLLHCSKTTCQDILKGTRFHTIIGNPRTLTFRTATNKAANAHKANLITKGKKSSNSEEHSNDEENSNSEENSNNEESPKLKNSSKTKKSPQPKKPSKGKKRAHEDVLQAEEEPGVNLPRPKAAAKRRRKA